MTLILSGTDGLSDVDGSAATPAIRGTDANTGIFFPAADTIAFSEGGVEAMRIDSSGNVGIGESSPSTYGKFVVSGGSNANAGIFIGNSSLTGSAPTYKGTVRIIDNPQSATGANGGLEFLTSTFGSGYGWRMASIDSSGVHLTFSTRQNSASWTESMRIDSSGNLLVGTTSGVAKLHVLANAAVVDPVTISNSDSGSGSQFAIVFRRNTSTTVGSIQTTNVATSYVTSSDYRLKENVQPMTGALEKVAALKPCTYTWKVDGSDGQGFIAHELQEVYPDAVTGEKDGEQMQGVDYGKLTPILTAALQEAIAKIETLEARISALEAK